MLGWWATAVLGTATTAFGSEDPLGPVDRGQWHHEQLARSAAAAEGWSAGAAAELGRHTYGVDLYAYHPFWIAYGGRSRWRGARMARDPLVNVHFDNLTSTAEIAEVWQRIQGGTVVGIQWAAQQDDARAARQVIGVGLHAIQDFYSHSTWIDDPARRGHTWLEDDGSTLDPGLSTGGFGPDSDAVPHRHGELGVTLPGRLRLMLSPLTLPAPLSDRQRLAFQAAKRVAGRLHGRLAGCPRGGPQSPPVGLREPDPDGINLDSRWQAGTGVRNRTLTGLDGDGAFALAYELAGRESRTWLNRLDRRFAADPALAAFWSRVRDGSESDWTGAFDDPEVLGYGFIAAGRYPPRGGADAAAWFHRVLVTTPPGRSRSDRAVESARLLVLDAEGWLLSSDQVPIGRAVTVGPLPLGATDLELIVPLEGRLQVHAFRRAPEPVLRLVIDRSLGVAEPRIRLPIDCSAPTEAAAQAAAEAATDAPPPPQDSA
jgi:hypothetical protein